jgi:hypothetical protein
MSADNNCIFYFVKLDSTGVPIPSTMMGRDNNKITKGLECVEARVPATQMSRDGQCFPDNGFRYYYKVNKTTGKILGNSMWQSQKVPNTFCMGRFNILEFIVYSTTV